MTEKLILIFAIFFLPTFVITNSPDKIELELKAKKDTRAEIEADYVKQKVLLDLHYQKVINKSNKVLLDTL